MVKRKKNLFLRDRLRWLAFPHDLASVPLADVECYTRRVFIRFLARDDIVVMVVAAVPSSIGVFLGLVPASFGSCVVDRATNRSFEQIYGRLAHEREVGVVAADEPWVLQCQWGWQARSLESLQDEPEWELLCAQQGLPTKWK